MSVNLNVSNDGILQLRLLVRRFAKLRKANISFVMSVCLSIRTSVDSLAHREQLGSH